MRGAPTLLIATALLASVAGSADAGETIIGCKGGLAVTSIYGDLGDVYDNRMGIVGGGFATLYFSEYVGVQAEFLYVMKGATATMYDEWDEYNFDYSFDYIEVPMLLKIRVPFGETVAPNAFMGPALALNVRAEGSVDGYEEDMADYISDIDLGIVAGVGLDVRFDTIVLTGDLRYELGLMNLLDEDEVGGDVASEKNHGVLIMIGAGFSL
jgi:hypothetical protein